MTVTLVAVPAATGRSSTPTVAAVPAGAKALPMNGRPATLTPTGAARTSGVRAGVGVPTNTPTVRMDVPARTVSETKPSANVVIVSVVTCEPGWTADCDSRRDTRIAAGDAHRQGSASGVRSGEDLNRDRRRATHTRHDLSRRRGRRNRDADGHAHDDGRLVGRGRSDDDRDRPDIGAGADRQDRHAIGERIDGERDRLLTRLDGGRRRGRHCRVAAGHRDRKRRVAGERLRQDAHRDR